MHTRLLVLISALVLTLAAPSDSRAQSVESHGYVSGTQEVMTSVPLADGLVARRILFRAVVTGDDEKSPYHLASQDCFASYIFSDDMPVGGRAACDGISPDGDIFWLSIEMSSDGVVHWRSTGGTGKFSNLVTSGTTRIVAQMDGGKFVGRYEGTYSSK